MIKETHVQWLNSQINYHQCATCVTDERLQETTHHPESSRFFLSSEMLPCGDPLIHGADLQEADPSQVTPRVYLLVQQEYIPRCIPLDVIYIDPDLKNTMYPCSPSACNVATFDPKRQTIHTPHTPEQNRECMRLRRDYAPPRIKQTDKPIITPTSIATSGHTNSTDSAIVDPGSVQEVAPPTPGSRPGQSLSAFPHPRLPTR